MTKVVSGIWLATAVVFSLIGLAFFIRLFVVGTNVFWFILSPIVFAVYQFPAVVVYALWKKRVRAASAAAAEETEETKETVETEPPPPGSAG